MNSKIIILLVAMSVTTYLVRMLPFTLFTSKIKSKFISDFLYYVPYAVLGAMTIPHIFYAGGSLGASITGTVVALVLAFRRCSLLGVAGAACLCAYIASFVF